MEKYLSETEKELLALIQYHRERIDKIEKQTGSIHPNDEQGLKMLDEAAELVAEQALRRKRLAEEKFNPITTTCPTCKTTIPRIPLFEKKDADGLAYDIFYCEACNMDYVNDLPNNGADQRKWFQRCLALIDRHIGDKEKLSPKEKENCRQMKESLREFERTHDAQQKAMQGVKDADDEIAKITIKFRDALLFAKNEGEWPDIPMGPT